MVKAILFDLDNTLLDIDFDGFMREYTEGLALRFVPLPPDVFASHLFAATRAAILNVMHRSKPSPEYYREIADRIGVAPSECLMVGDDRAMDGPASEAGKRVALVGPERPSNMVRRVLGPAADRSLPALARYPSLEALHAALEQEGIV